VCSFRCAYIIVLSNNFVNGVILRLLLPAAVLLLAAIGGDMGRQRKQQSAEPLAVVGRVLSRDASMLARVAAPADADAARLVAKALRDPARVARLIEGMTNTAAKSAA
jgi:hypothetical protein